MWLNCEEKSFPLHFEGGPVASSILYTMRDPKRVINCGEERKMEVNEVKDLENQLPKAEHLLEISLMHNSSNEIQVASISSVDPTLTQISDEISLRGSSSNEIRGARITSLDSTLTQVTDAAATPTKASKKRGSEAVHSNRYKQVMETLRKPVCSYTLLYGQHLAQTSKAPRKRGRSKKTPTKKRAEELGSFPKNVKCLLGTGMLDGVPVQYLSASREIGLRGMIKGSSYLCGCKSCNYSKEVNADEFENHADCKTCHPNNHIHLENGKSIHQAVQELKNTPRRLLCDAIQSVLGTSLNQEAFSSWKESFGAQECSSEEEI